MFDHLGGLFCIGLVLMATHGCGERARAYNQAMTGVRSTAGCYRVEFGTWSDSLPQDLQWVHAAPSPLQLDTILEPHPSNGFRLAPTNPSSAAFASGWMLSGDDSVVVMWEGVQLRLKRQADLLVGRAFAYGHAPTSQSQAVSTVRAVRVPCGGEPPRWPAR